MVLQKLDLLEHHEWTKTTCIYHPIDNFAKFDIVEVLQIGGVTSIYWPIDGFAKVEFVNMF